MKLVDLSQPWSAMAPPWPTYNPPEVKFIKRIAEHRVNGQLITTTNHCGTHMDGPLHFCSNGKDIASIPLDRLYGPGVIVDISELGEYGIIKPHHITSKVEVKKGDILIWHTGFHHHAYCEPEADETKYFCKHPGPDHEMVKWAREMELRWIGVDCGSADHPMNTVIKRLRPDLAEECEKKLGKSLDSIFKVEDYQMMHTKLFPYDIIHAENLGGDIDKLLNQRVTIGAFPWRFVGGESCICRIVAFIEE